MSEDLLPRIVDDYLTMVGLKIEPLEKEKLDENWIPLGGENFAQVQSVLQYIPSIATNRMNGGETYRVIFDKGLGALQKSAKHEGFYLGNIVDPISNTNYKGQALLQATSIAPEIANAVFSSVSFVTGQYYMAQINYRLEEMKDVIEDVREFLENDKKSQMQGTEAFLAQVRCCYDEIIHNPYQRQSTIINIQNIKRDTLGWMSFYRMQADSIPGKVHKNDKNGYIWEKINELSKEACMYWYSIYLYCYAVCMEAVIAENTSSTYFQFMIDDIEDKIACYKEDYKKWSYFLDKFLQSAKAYKQNKTPVVAAKVAGFAVPYILIPSLACYAGPAINEVVDIIVDKDKKRLEKKRESIKMAFNNPIDEKIEMEPMRMTVDFLNQYNKHMNEKYEVVSVKDKMFIKKEFI